MITGLAFFDTNILVYTDDARTPRKQAAAIQLLGNHQEANTAVISTQVMQEYFVAATRKLGVPAEVAQRKLEILARGRVVRLEERDVIGAIEINRLTSVSFWDALILQAARAVGAIVIYSEDLQNGTCPAGVKIVNPFAQP